MSPLCKWMRNARGIIFLGAAGMQPYSQKIQTHCSSSSEAATRICSLGVLQFQTDYCETAAKRAADRRFLYVDLALIIIPRDVPRTVW